MILGASSRYSGQYSVPMAVGEEIKKLLHPKTGWTEISCVSRDIIQLKSNCSGYGSDTQLYLTSEYYLTTARKAYHTIKVKVSLVLMFGGSEGFPKQMRHRPIDYHFPFLRWLAYSINRWESDTYPLVLNSQDECIHFTTKAE